MKASEFDRLLEKAREAIQDAADVDDSGRELLEFLDRDIRALLKRTEDIGASALPERVRVAIRHFEVTHPVLTAVLSEISTILSNAGI
ncbi:MAG: DUF4404 family protein [Chloroflexi bacterium]|nr:DUF4404 family protein [Chloroflexota bacterium]